MTDVTTGSWPLGCGIAEMLLLGFPCPAWPQLPNCAWVRDQVIG